MALRIHSGESEGWGLTTPHILLRRGKEDFLESSALLPGPRADKFGKQCTAVLDPLTEEELVLSDGRSEGAGVTSC